MSSLKKCDKCGAEAPLPEGPNPFHDGRSPGGWGVVTFAITKSALPPRANDPDPMRVADEGAVVGEGVVDAEFEVIEHSDLPSQWRPYVVQAIDVVSSVDLCGECLAVVVQATGCAERIEREPAMHGHHTIVGGYPPPPWGPRRPHRHR